MLVGGHYCRVNANILLSNAGNGITTGTGSYSVIDDNALLSNGGYGIKVAAGSTDIVIGTDNTYSSNPDGAVSDSGTGTIRQDLAVASLWQPSDNGLLMATSDPVLASVPSSVLVAGTLYLVKLIGRQPLTISDLWFAVTAAGSDTSTGTFGGLYSSSGSKLTGSSDIAASLTTLNPTACALTTPETLTAGLFVWVALLVNLGTTMPTLAKGVGNNGLLPNIGLTAATYRWAVNGTGLTSLPSSITPASNVATTYTIWCGAS